MQRQIEVQPGVTATITALEIRDEEVWVKTPNPEDLADQDGEVHTDAEGWVHLGQVEDFPDIAA